MKLKVRWIDSEGKTQEGIMISIKVFQVIPGNMDALQGVGIVIPKGTFTAIPMDLSKLEVLVK